MGAWDELTGQEAAITALQDAVVSPEAMTHSWLITGPPGSGRSNLAFAFATALLQASQTGAEATRTAAQVAARTHPDLAVLATDRVIISIDEVRHLVSQSQFSPSVSPYRVIVIEDADRMTERTSNVLLKALEEPPPRTVWILCAPSAADLIATIRSRVRTVRLRVPSVAEVAALLVRRDGVEPARAERAARESQSHIGMAGRLATDDDARARRARTLELALNVHSVSGAVLAAEKLVAVATDDAKALTAEREVSERAAALRSLGVEPGATVPMGLRASLKALDEDQKRRATR
jgi:DNA polymerase-3 subunit delta'